MGLSAPKLEGWMTLVEVAELFDVTRQSVTYWAKHGGFATLRSVGSRSLYVVQVGEVDRLAKLFAEEGSWTRALQLLKSSPGE
jgi:hypothetical protein